jgi:DNA adenine methylase
MDPVGTGFATFYLNRTNHSGVLNGGPIGGRDQSGNYRIDARFNKDALIERMRLIQIYSSQIEVRNEDGIEIISEFANVASTFIYADPPYFEKAGSLYMNSFGPEDHHGLAACLNQRCTSRWLLTYDNHPEVTRLYADRRRELIPTRYSAHRTLKVNEVMIFSDSI